jgi:hypothetical protein
MDIVNTVISQYYAALAMLEDAIGKCPDDLWSSDQYGNPVYQIAYHAIFYAHLYVQPAASDFTPWEKHADYHSGFGEPAYPGAPAPEPADPYSKDELLTYVQLCREEIARIVPALDFEAAESGFPWLPFGKLELQFYSIRHVMLHVGELAERLSATNGIEVGWVGKGPDAA